MEKVVLRSLGKRALCRENISFCSVYVVKDKEGV